MSLRIIDTFQNIDKCFTATGFCKKNWDLYLQCHLPYAKEAIEKDSAEYDFEKQVLPVLNNAYREKEKAAKLLADMSPDEIEKLLYECIDRSMR